MRILTFALAAALFAAVPALAQVSGSGQTILNKSQTKIQDRIEPTAPDNGAALEKQIARLKEEVASLKAEIASLRAPPPPPVPPQTVPPQPAPPTANAGEEGKDGNIQIRMPTAEEIAYVRDYLAHAWHRLVEMLVGAGKDTMRKG
jgi:cell division protein FtsB